MDFMQGCTETFTFTKKTIYYLYIYKYMLEPQQYYIYYKILYIIH